MKKIFITVILFSLLLFGCGKTDGENKVNTDLSTEEISVSTENIPQEDSEAEEENETEVEIDNGEDGYTFQDLNKVMYAKSAVNVRSIPSSEGDKLGGLTTNQEVLVTGQCNETSWYRITYGESVGYVSNTYLADEMVPVSSQVNNQGEAKDELFWHQRCIGGYGYYDDDGKSYHCVVLYGVHYEVTEKVQELVLDAGYQASLEWRDAYRGYYTNYGYGDMVVVHTLGSLGVSMTVEEFESFHLKDQTILYENGDAYDADLERHEEAAKYEKLMECGYIRTLPDPGFTGD